MIHGPRSLAKQPVDGHNAGVSVRSSGWGKRRGRVGGDGRGALTAELLVLGGQHEGLRDDVEVLEAVRLLHALDVLVQAVLARQLVGPETRDGTPPHAARLKIELERSQRGPT